MHYCNVNARIMDLPLYLSTTAQVWQQGHCFEIKYGYITIYMSFHNSCLLWYLVSFYKNDFKLLITVMSSNNVTHAWYSVFCTWYHALYLMVSHVLLSSDFKKSCMGNSLHMHEGNWKQAWHHIITTDTRCKPHLADSEFCYYMQCSYECTL